MSKQKLEPTKTVKIFNIDNEAKKCYPKEHSAYPQSIAPVFSMIKHHISEPKLMGNISMQTTYKQAA